MLFPFSRAFYNQRNEIMGKNFPTSLSTHGSRACISIFIYFSLHMTACVYMWPPQVVFFYYFGFFFTDIFCSNTRPGTTVMSCILCCLTFATATRRYVNAQPHLVTFICTLATSKCTIQTTVFPGLSAAQISQNCGCKYFSTE